MPSELVDQRGGLGLDAVGLLVLDFEALAGSDKEGAVDEDVAVGAPVPAAPLGLGGLDPLGYLLGVAVVWRGVAVALAVDCGVSAASDCVHFPLGEVVVDHVDVATSASRHPLH